MASRRSIAILCVVGAGLVVVGAASILATQDEASSRGASVAERGAQVMPFSLDATTHVFDATGSGGTQRVVADDPSDTDEIRLVREHLREEAAAFRRGDFGDPATIHGQDMPGLAALEQGFERIDVTYRDLPNGGEVAFRTGDRSLVAALGDWFEAQLSDHGADARTNDAADRSDPGRHGSTLE